MNDVRQLFQDIKGIFKSEGVDTEPTLEAKDETKVETTVKPTEETTKEATEKDETLETKFEDVTLADGSIAQIEPDVSLGAAVVIQVEDELIAAPDGDYELADGRVITVESGTIVDVQDPMLEEVEETPSEVVVEEEVVAKDQPPFTNEQRKEAKKIIESIVTEKHFASVDDTKKLDADVVALKEAFKKLLVLTEELMSNPTTKPVKASKSGYSYLKNNKKKDIITRLKEKNIIN